MPVQSIAIAAGGRRCFSPFAYGEHEGIATVNAGNPGLWVGGDGINNTFSQALQYSHKYETLHKSLLEEPIPAGEFISDKGIAGVVPETFVKIGDIKTQGSKPATGEAPDGTIIIDILSPDAFEPSRGEKSPPNKAVVYVVPPNRVNYASDQDFLDAVTQTAVNMVKTIQAYNEAHPAEEITTLRTCAFSSDLFAGTQGQSAAVQQEMADKVVQSIVTGIQQGIEAIDSNPSQHLTISKIEYEDRQRELFTKAANRLGVPITPE